MEDSSAAAPRELLLVGGGHSHVQVLRRWMASPMPAVRLTIVVDRPIAVYSGMVPGFVAGDYEAHEVEIDVEALARAAGARIVLKAVERVDAEAKVVEVADGEPVRYDVASIDVGSTVRQLEVPGVAEHALASRPIHRLIGELPDRVAAAGRDGPLRLVVVGAGAGGVELAFTLRARVARSRAEAPVVTVLDRGGAPLTHYPASLVRRVLRHASEHGIVFRQQAVVERVEADAVVLADGDRVPADLVLWVTGAAAHAMPRRSGLPVDDRGYIRVRSTLQVEAHNDLFAVGDCAFLVDHPWVPRAGVYAVREGPIVDENLRARLLGERLRRYRPQRDFLSLLNLGDGIAVGAKWGVTVQGRWVWRLKDRIDRSFMKRFRVGAASTTASAVSDGASADA